MRTSTIAKAFFYTGLVMLLGLALTQSLSEVIPGKLGLFLSRNSEAYMALLVLCPWIDWVRPRLLGRSIEWPVAVSAGAGLLLAGLALREAPWGPQIVTLNEALIGCSLIIPYLQQRRPAVLWSILLAGGAIMVPVVWAGSDAFVTDMAEAFGMITAVVLVVAVLDAGLLRGLPVNRVRSLWSAAAALVAMLLVHRLTPTEPTGVFEHVLFFVQRANEGLLVLIVMLPYYASRPALSRPRGTRSTSVTSVDSPHEVRTSH